MFKPSLLILSVVFSAFVSTKASAVQIGLWQCEGNGIPSLSLIEVNNSIQATPHPIPSYVYEIATLTVIEGARPVTKSFVVHQVLPPSGMLGAPMVYAADATRTAPAFRLQIQADVAPRPEGYPSYVTTDVNGQAVQQSLDCRSVR